MAAVLGLNCKAYQNTGTVGSPTWTERTAVTSVSVSNSLATADVTRRGNNGYRAKVGTLAEGDVTFDLIYDTADAFFSVVEEAFRERTTIDMWFGTASTTTNGAIGFRAAFAVTDFSEEQALEDAVRYSVTLSVSGTSPTPGYYESDGTALAIVGA